MKLIFANCSYLKSKILAVRCRPLFYLMFFFVIFIFTFLFSSLGQLVGNRLLEEKHLIQESVPFDYTVRFPDKRQYDLFNQRRASQKTLPDILNEHFFSSSAADSNIDFRQYFDYFLQRTAHFYDSQSENIIVIQTVTPVDKNFNKLVLSNTENQRRPTSVLSPAQGVLSQRFFDQKFSTSFSPNKKVIWKNFFNRPQYSLEIVGTGSQISSYSTDYSTIIKLVNQKFISDNDYSVYDKIGFLYVTDETFDRWVNIDKFIIDYRNILFLKAKKSLKNDAIVKQLAKQYENLYQFYPTIQTYEKDINSGLKIDFNQKLNYFFIGVFVFSFFIILLFSFFFETEETKKNKNKYRLFYGLGYGFSFLAAINAIRDFLFIFFAAMIGFILGAFAYRYFLNWTLNSINLTISSFPYTWWGFLIFILGPSLVWSFIIFIYSFFRMRKILLPHHFQPRISMGITIIFSSLWRAFYFFQFIPNFSWKVLNFFVFKNGWKQIIVFIFSLILFAFSFMIIFLKLSFDNYLRGQNSFLNSNVQSVTQFSQSVEVTEGGKLKSNLNFAPRKNFNFCQSGDTCENDDEANRNVLRHINDEVPDSRAFFTRTLLSTDEQYMPEGLNFYIDQRSGRVYSSLFHTFNMSKLLFNYAPFEEDIDLPVLSLHGQINRKNGAVIETELTQQFNSQLYYLNFNKSYPNPKEYLSVFDSVHMILPEIKILPNGKISTVDNSRYVFVSDDFRTRYGYKLGDFIDGLKILSSNEVLEPTRDVATPSLQIGGFFDPKIVLKTSIYADYRYISEFYFNNPNAQIYNLILTRKTPERPNPKTHFSRFSVVDVVRSLNYFGGKTNLLNEFSSFNNISPNISLQEKARIMNNFYQKIAMANQSAFDQKEGVKSIYVHFWIFSVLLDSVLSFGILFLLMILFLMSFMLFAKNQSNYVTLRQLGYHVGELMSNYLIFFVFKKVIASLLAFFLSYFIFYLIMTWMSGGGILIPSFADVQLNLLYIFLGILIFTIPIVIKQIYEFKKQKLNVVFSRNIYL